MVNKPALSNIAPLTHMGALDFKLTNAGKQINKLFQAVETEWLRTYKR